MPTEEESHMPQAKRMLDIFVELGPNDQAELLDLGELKLDRQKKALGKV